MDFSMRLFAVASLLLFVSMATDMGGLPVADAHGAPVCNQFTCDRACRTIGLFGCCRGVARPECDCRPTSACPRNLDTPLVIDVKREVCDRELCGQACKPLGKVGCCAGYPGRCTCRDTKACPFLVTVEIDDNKDMVIEKAVA